MLPSNPQKLLNPIIGLLKESVKKTKLRGRLVEKQRKEGSHKRKRPLQ
jgi:hypothetical protein